MLDYKEIIIKHYGGGMSGSELAALKLGSRSGINDFLRAFEAYEKIRYALRYFGGVPHWSYATTANRKYW